MLSLFNFALWTCRIQTTVLLLRCAGALRCSNWVDTVSSIALKQSWDFFLQYQWLTPSDKCWRQAKSQSWDFFLQYQWLTPSDKCWRQAKSQLWEISLACRQLSNGRNKGLPMVATASRFPSVNTMQKKWINWWLLQRLIYQSSLRQCLRFAFRQLCQ